MVSNLRLEDGAWCMVSNLRLEHGAWCMVSNLRLEHGAWCMVHGASSMQDARCKMQDAISPYARCNQPLCKMQRLCTSFHIHMHCTIGAKRGLVTWCIPTPLHLFVTSPRLYTIGSAVSFICNIFASTMHHVTCECESRCKCSFGITLCNISSVLKNRFTFYSVLSNSCFIKSKI